VVTGSAEALAARLGKLQTQVIERKTQISALETKLATTEAEIEAKSSKATQLIAQKQQYQSTLKEKEKQRQTILIFALFGAFGGASAAVGLGSALSISELNTTIAKLDQEIAATQKDKIALESSLGVYKADQRVRRRELDALQAAEQGLTQDHEDVSALPPAQHVASLRGQIDDTQKLATNLRQQIELLQDMNDAASGMNGSLDSVIGALQADLESLETRIKASEKALMGAIIDLVFKASGVPPNIQIGGLSISKKALLLDGLPGLRRELDKQVDKLVDKMIKDGLVDGGTAPDMASLIVKLLRKSLTAAPAKSTTLASMTDEAIAKLSEPQRLVIDSVMHLQPASPEREELIGDIAARTSLTDIRARAIAAIAALEEGPAGGKSDAIAAVMGKASITKREAAKAMIDFGLSTTYGESASGEDIAKSLERQAVLARRTITLFASDAPAAKALADGLEAYDASTKTATEDHALLRATLLSARALTTLPDASADRIALEMVRGFKEASSHRSGDGASDRQLLDAQRTAASLGRFLPASDPILTAPLPADLAGATAWLSSAEQALAARA